MAGLGGLQGEGQEHMRDGGGKLASAIVARVQGWCAKLRTSYAFKLLANGLKFCSLVVAGFASRLDWRVNCVLSPRSTSQRYMLSKCEIPFSDINNLELFKRYFVISQFIAYGNTSWSC